MKNTYCRDASEELMRFIAPGTSDDVIERYASLKQHAAATDFGVLDRNVVVLDTETTGVSFNHDELTQIAAARIEKGEIVDWFNTFVNPGKPIPDDVAHLTDIHDEDVRDAPSPTEALTALVQFVGDAKIVAHNAAFDRTFTTKHPAGYPLLENLWIDSLDLARIAVPRMKSHRLIDLVTALGGPLSTHRADDDVAATCSLYRMLLAAVDLMPDDLVHYIGESVDAREWPTAMVFKLMEEWKTSNSYQGARSQRFDDEIGPLQLFETKAGLSLSRVRRRRVGKIDRRAKRDARDLGKPGMPGLKVVSSNEVESAFSPDGILGMMYESYERREEQVEMSLAIRNSLAKSDNLVVEAGTGVGKSMAYLVPLALLALENNITVGVATKTNALLDQLVYKELPALDQALAHLAGRGSNEGVLDYAALKGFSHYPCLRKIQKLVDDGPSTRTVGNEEKSQAPALAGLLSFIDQTDYDDIDGLKIDYRLLPRKMITTSSHDCLRRKCPFFGTQCFVHGARRIAESAHVVVTNHSLMFCDLAADGGLLPPVRHWVVDEAHNAEAEARRAFSIDISSDDLVSLARRVSAGSRSRSVFDRAERNVTLSDVEGETLFYALLNKARSAGEEFSEVALPFPEKLRGLLYFEPAKKGRGYEYVDLWINQEIRNSSIFKELVEQGSAMVEKAEKLIRATQDLVAQLEEVDSAAAVQREIAVVAIELKELVKACEAILFSGSDQYVYAAHMCRKAERGGDAIEALPYSVAPLMNETLFDQTDSVVFASATLSVAESFSSFETAMGLNQGESSHCATLALDSSYDFDRNMTIYVVDDMPEPQEPQYLKRLQELLVKTHLAQHGSMLTLFTNRREMERCFDEVQPVLKQNDLRLICQKWGVSVKGLRDDFLSDEHLSLFALKSFWEGFDAPGATLKGVIIPKLPFSKPTDPLSCERAARDDAAWRKYVLPAAILETKQAAGRLIRRADDEGVLILADKRLLTKGYGRSFLRSMPSSNIKSCSIDDIAREIARG